MYYVHKAMIAVGSCRSKLLGRRIHAAVNSSRNTHPDGHSSQVNVHQTVKLESAANTMGMVLDFCYHHDRPLDINVESAAPRVYLGKRALIIINELIINNYYSYFLESCRGGRVPYPQPVLHGGWVQGPCLLLGHH